MKYNRYKILKMRNKRSVILLLSKDKYISYERDKRILGYINFNNNLCELDKRNINYVVLDNLNIIEDKKYDCNNYMKYLKLSYLKDILLKLE